MIKIPLSVYFHYLHSCAKINIHGISIKHSSLSKAMSLDSLVDRLELRVVEKYDFEDLDFNFNRFFAFFGRLRIGSKKSLNAIRFNGKFGAEAAQKTKKSCHQCLIEISEFHGIGTNINFGNVFKADRTKRSLESPIKSFLTATKRYFVTH